MTGSYFPHEDNQSSEFQDPCLSFLIDGERSNVDSSRKQMPLLDKHRTDEDRRKRRHRKRSRRRQREHAPCSEQVAGDSKYLVQHPVFDGFGNAIDSGNKESHSAHIGKCTKEGGDNSMGETTESMPDFSWLYSDITDDVQPIRDPAVDFVHARTTLSQSMQEAASDVWEQTSVIDIEDERLAIEAEIKRKCCELEDLLDRMSTKRRRKRRRRARQAKNDEELELSVDSARLNICPIRRNKRLAQPIRNAVLIRSSMKKAWQGALGSCCGMGCWATWKWVNLKYVISDYE